MPIASARSSPRAVPARPSSPRSRSRGRTTSVRSIPPACGGSSPTCRSIASSSRRRPPTPRGVVELIRIAKAAGVRVSVLPRMLEVVGSAVEFDDVDGMTVLGVRQFGLSRSSRLLKRAFDFVGDLRRPARGRPDPGRARRGDPARLARPDLLPPGPRRPRRQALRDLQVPLDGHRRGRPQGRAARPQRGRRRHVQDHRRPARHPGRATCCARRRSTSCRSSSTCCAAR